MTKATGEY